MDPENAQQTPQRTEPQTINVSQGNSGGGLGPLIAIIIILIVIVIGGLYFWLSQENIVAPMNDEQAEQQDDLAEIEAQFNTQEFNDIENDSSSIDAEF